MANSDPAALVMLGYWGDEAKSAEAIDAAGWMHTGDIATIDDGATATSSGALKDMVIRGGGNIYPREIEEFVPPSQGAGRAGGGRPRPASSARNCAPGSSSLARRATRRTSAISARARSPTTRCPLHPFQDNFPMTITGKIQKFHDPRADEAGT